MIIIETLLTTQTFLTRYELNRLTFNVDEYEVNQTQENSRIEFLLIQILLKLYILII